MNDTHQAAWEAALQQLPLIALLRATEGEELEARFDAAVAAGFRLIALPLDELRDQPGIERLVGRCPEGVMLAAECSDAETCARLAELGLPLGIVSSDSALVDAAAASGLGALVRCTDPADARRASEAGAQAALLTPAAGAGIERVAEIRGMLSSSTRLFILGLDETTMAEWIGAGVDGLGFDESLGETGSAEERGRALIAEWRRVRETLIQAEMFEREGDA